MDKVFVRKIDGTYYVDIADLQRQQALLARAVRYIENTMEDSYYPECQCEACQIIATYRGEVE